MSGKTTTKRIVSFEETILVNQLKPYAKNPFSVPAGNVFDEMVNSIKEEGVLQQILVRKTDEKNGLGHPIYEIISGHMRVEAAKAAGLTNIPARVAELNDDEAAIKAVEANFRRTYSTPSELGKAFKLRLDALNRQGKRPDDTSVQNEQRSSRDEVAIMFNISPSKVHRYMRLAYLMPEFQSSVDGKKMLLSVAENISYLNESEQKTLYELLVAKKQQLTRPQSTKLKSERVKADKAGDSANLTKEQIQNILNDTDEMKRDAKKPVSKRTLFETISKHKFFEGKELSNEEIQDVLLKALDRYGEQ